MAIQMSLQDLQRSYRNARGGNAPSEAAIPLQPGMPGYGQDNFDWELQNNLNSGTWKSLGGDMYELPDIPKESGIDAFMNSAGLPLAIFGAGMGATGGLSNLFGGGSAPSAGGGGGNFMGAGVDPVTAADVGTPGMFEFGGSTGGVPGLQNLGGDISRLTGEAGMPSFNTSGGGGIMDTLKSVFAPSGGGSGSYQFPWGRAISSVLSALGNRGQQKDLESLMRSSADRADPFGSQRPQYQQQLSQLTQQPSNFFNDPAIAAAIKAQMDKTNRYMASQGYNMSGNQMTEVNNAGMREAFGQYMPFLERIGQFAGAGINPASAGDIMAKVGGQASQAGNQGYGDMGALLQSVLSGNQPSLVDILRNSQGTDFLDIIRSSPQNQDLISYLFGGK